MLFFITLQHYQKLPSTRHTCFFSAVPRVHLQIQMEPSLHRLKTHMLTGLTLLRLFCTHSEMRQRPTRRESQANDGEMGGSRGTKEGYESGIKQLLKEIVKISNVPPCGD